MTALDSKKIDRLFEHRHELDTKCLACNQICSTAIDEEFTCNIYLDELKRNNKSLKDYLLSHNPQIDNNYICPKCNVRGHKIQQRDLVMLPEIIIILFKKYNNKWVVPYPSQLRFGKLVYNIISQTEHSGTQSGGHYWAKAKRHILQSNKMRERIMTLNDTSVSSGNFVPNQSVYMLWYHIV